MTNLWVKTPPFLCLGLYGPPLLNMLVYHKFNNTACIKGLSSSLQILCCVIATCLFIGFCVSLPHIHCPVILALLITCAAVEARAERLLGVMLPKLAVYTV